MFTGPELVGRQITLATIALDSILFELTESVVNLQPNTVRESAYFVVFTTKLCTRVAPL